MKMTLNQWYELVKEDSKEADRIVAKEILEWKLDTKGGWDTKNKPNTIPLPLMVEWTNVKKVIDAMIKKGFEPSMVFAQGKWEVIFWNKNDDWEMGIAYHEDLPVALTGAALIALGKVEPENDHEDH